MKIKRILFTLTALSISALASAAGVTPDQIESARRAGTLQQVWIAGASAPAMPIYKGWVKGCQPGTNSIFFRAQGFTETTIEPGSLGDFYAYACLRSGLTSVLYVTQDGGSLNAFTPFTIGTKLARLSFLGNSSAAGGKLATGYVDANEPIYNADVYRGSSVTGSAVLLDATGVQTPGNQSSNAAAVAADLSGPQQIVGGFSDVEPSMFPSSIGGGNVSTYGSVNNAFLGQVFGVVVSVPLYRKLQEIQGISEVATEYKPILAPSLTKGQIATILRDGGSVQNTESWYPILRIEEGEKVIIHRRRDFSGTQAVANAFFLGNPCLGSSALTPSSVTSGNYQVELNYRDWNVKSGITIASNASAGSRYAIGMMSLVNNDWVAERAGYAQYRYIKVDGVHPQLSGSYPQAEVNEGISGRMAAASGIYPLHMEMKTFVSHSAPAGFQKNIITTIVNNIKNPSSSDACRWLPTGLTINPNGGNLTCREGIERARFTNDGDNCAIPTVY